MVLKSWQKQKNDKIEHNAEKVVKFTTFCGKIHHEKLHFALFFILTLQLEN